MPRLLRIFFVCIGLACTRPAHAEEQKENPSNPLAAASNVDLKAKYLQSYSAPLNHIFLGRKRCNGISLKKSR